MKRKKRLTLIEVLIFVFIATTILALLLPALGRARESARRANCMSNLKQIGLALKMYSQDNQDFFPRTLNDVNRDGNPGTAADDLQLLVPKYLENPENPITNLKMFVCPSSTTEKEMTRFLLPFNISYAYARSLDETDVETVIMCDQSSNDFKGPKSDSFYYADIDGKKHLGLIKNHYSDNVNFSEGVNALYVDDSVKWVPLENIPKQIPNYDNHAKTKGCLRNAGMN